MQQRVIQANALGRRVPAPLLGAEHRQHAASGAEKHGRVEDPVLPGASYLLTAVQEDGTRPLVLGLQVLLVAVT